MTEDYKRFDKNFEFYEDTISIRGHAFKKREVALGATAVIALIVVVILAALLASVHRRGGGTPAASGTKQPCLDGTCFKMAAHVLETLKTSVDPCTNFYQYACGNWARHNPLKPDMSQRTPAYNIYYDNEQKLRRLMETPSSTNITTSNEKKLKDYFSSCTDHYGKMQLQGTPFLEQVVENTGGWYVLGTLNNTTYDFEDSLKKTHVDYWTDALFTFTIITDRVNWLRTSIQIDLSGTGLSWIYYVRSDTQDYLDRYKEFMRTVAGFLLRDSGVKLDNNTAKERLDTFVSDAYMIEEKLANITANSDPTSKPHEHENRLSLHDLNRMTNKAIDWVDFFTYMFKDAGVNGNTKVVVLEQDYIVRVSEMITNLGGNSSRILNNYLTWRLAHKYVQDLSWDYIHANREFYVAMTGEAEFLGTWNYCMRMVDRDMGEALSSLYVKDHFSDKNRDKAHDIVDYLKQSLENSLMKDFWMDKSTRDKAREKIHGSLFKMGYPDLMMNNTQLDKMYSPLQIDKYDYLGNRLNMNKFYKADWNRRLKEGTNVEEWTYSTYTVVAEYYNPWKEMIVPAGLLQWPLYDHKLPHYMNFGALGTILGHNLVHAIDEYGAQYKLDGSWFGDWWTNNTKNKYKDVTKCVVDAYANKTMGPFGGSDPIQVNAVGYAPEALAETSGVRLAYQAFKLWEAGNKVERQAPGINRNNDQMFFISYAQANCFNRNNQESLSQAGRNIVQENIKVNMALSQIPEFRQAFQCSANSRMVAKKLCNMY